MSLSKYSRIMRRIFQVLFVLIPIGIIYFWMTAGTSYGYLSDIGVFHLPELIAQITKSPLSLPVRFGATIVSLAYSLILMWALVMLIRLFSHYEKGEIFSERNVTIYRRLGHCVFYWFFAGIVYEAILTAVLSMNNPPGHRMFMFGATATDIVSLLVGVIILGIARVMREGQRLADENEYTI